MKSERLVFRVTEELNEYLFSKANQASISMSELVRIILESDKLLTISPTEIYSICHDEITTKKLKFIIGIRINEERAKWLKSVASNIGVNLGLLMRAIILQDNTEIVARDYLLMCLEMLPPIGVLINQIAYQLNLENVMNKISELSYQVASSRLLIVDGMLGRLTILLVNLPCNSLTQSTKTKINNKKDVITWISKLNPICNNISQIANRTYADFLATKIQNLTFQIMINRLNKIEDTVKLLYDDVKFISKELAC